jgi:hypothetical protein
MYFGLIVLVDSQLSNEHGPLCCVGLPPIIPNAKLMSNVRFVDTEHFGNFNSPFQQQLL